MTLLVSRWTKTLKKLAFKTPQKIPTARSHRQKQTHSQLGYESLELRKLLAVDLFFVPDASRDQVFQYDESGQQEDQISLGRSNARGTSLSADGSTQLVVDANRRVYSFDIETQQRIGQWKMQGVVSPQGIAVDGEHVLVVDRVRDRVFRFENGAQFQGGEHRPDSSFRLSRFNRQPTGIATDGENIWVTDRATDAVFVYSMQGSLVGAWSLDSKVSQPTGIAIDQDSNLWVVDQRDRRVYGFEGGKEFRQGYHRSDADFKLARRNRNPQGLALSEADSQVPNRPVILSITDDTGQSATDQITNDVSLVIAGSADPGTIVEITLGTDSLGTATATSEGQWVLDATAFEWQDGQFILLATATNDAGTSPNSNAFQVTIDTIAPAQPIIDRIDQDTGRSNSDGVTADTSLRLIGRAEANSWVTISEPTLGELAVVQTSSDGEWQATLSNQNLGDGVYSFEAQVADIAGNESDSTSLFVTLDSIAPERPVIDGISDDTGRRNDDGVTNSATQTITGTAEANAAVTLWDDGVALVELVADASGNWSTLLTLTEGTHLLTATATDLAGNDSLASSPLRVTVDLTRPAPPIIVGISEDTNEVDGVTGDSTLTVSGTSEPLAIIRVDVSGLGEVGVVEADADGQWSLVLGESLADGRYEISATGEDVAGNLSEASDAFAIVVDTTAPTAPSIFLIEEDTGASQDDAITNDNRLVFSGFAEAESRVVLVEQNLGTLGVAEADINGVWSLDLTGTELGDGDYLLTATARDLAGNVSPNSNSFALTIDTVAPNQPSIESIESDTGVVGDGITSDAELIFRGIAEAGSRVTLRETVLGEIGSTTADATGAWVIDATDRTLVNAEYTFGVVSEDLAGNVSQPSEDFRVTVDSENPDAPSIVRVDADTGLSDNDSITNDNTLLFTGLGPASQTIRIFEVSLGTIGESATNAAGVWTFDFTGTQLDDGSYEFSAIAIDAAGNPSPASSPLQVMIDTLAPGVPTIDELDQDTGLSNTDRITADATPTIRGTAEPNSRVALTETQLGLLATVGVDADGQWEYTPSLLSDRTYELTVTAIDTAGNESESSDPFGFTVDTLGPGSPSVLRVTEDTGVSDSDAITSDPMLSVSGTAEPGVRVTLTEASLNVSETTIADLDGNWQIDISVILLDDGDYHFRAVSTDIAGNESPISDPLRVVIDTAAPSQPTLGLALEFDTDPVGDLMTLDAVVTLEGTTEPGANVVLVETNQSTVADAEGDFSFDFVALQEGANVFNVVASDVAGNESSLMQTITRLVQIDSRPLVVAQLLNDTGSSNRDWVTTDPTLVGSVMHPSAVSVEFVLNFDGFDGPETLSTDVSSLMDSDGNFTIGRAFLESLFPGGVMSPGNYRYQLIASDASNSDNQGYHFGELFLVPPGGDSPPISTRVGLLNDTGLTATDRYSTDPTLVGFVEGQNITTVEFYYDSAGPGLFADITDRLDANGDFTLDQAFLESVIGGPLEFGRHEYHVVAQDADGNFAFRYNDFAFIESDDDDITLPVLELTLANDSGASDSDNITNDASIVGTVVDESSVELFFSITDLDTFDFYEAAITDLLQADGSFEVSQTRIESIVGEPLRDTTYEIVVSAIDRYSTTNEFLIVTIDSTVPAIPRISSIATDTGVSDSDGITSDPTLIVVGQAEPNATVELTESSLGVLGTVVADELGEWRFEITGPGLVDGDYSFTARAISLGGGTSDSSASFAVTVDTNSPLRATFDLAAEFDTGDLGDGYTTLGVVDIVGVTSAGAIVKLLHNDAETVADADGNFRFAGVALDVGTHLYEVQTSTVAGNTMISKRRLRFDQPVTLSDDSFVTAESRTIAIGSVGTGSRTISFEVDAAFGSGNPILEDTLLVYVLDPSDAATVVDRGIEGTPAFSLTGDVPEFRSGVVRFDGRRVEIDVTSLDLAEVELRFELIDHDGANDSAVQISNFDFQVDPDASASPVGRGVVEVEPGESLDLGSLSLGGDLELVYENIRYDASTDEYQAAVRVRNGGADVGRSMAVLFDGLPAGVTMQNASGVDGNGDPYLNVSDSIPAYGLLAGQMSDAVLVKFTGATSPWVAAPKVLDSGAPVAPSIDAVSDLSMMPGEILELQLTSTGGEGVYFTLDNDGSLPDMNLNSDGRLRIAPKPDQTGTFTFQVFANDGVRQSAETINLSVVNDTDTTSRISGVVMDTLSNPLAGIPVELGGIEVLTAADGTFVMSFPGSIPDGAMKFHGEAFAGPEVYPFVAEKLPLLFGHEPFDNINNVIDRPIYLPALDVANGVTIDPTVDVTVTTSNIPNAAVHVPAGSLKTEAGDDFTGELSITVVPNDFTPAALPPDLFPDLVVTIQPGEMVFSVPAPLDLPNVSGFAPGTEMTLWSINPITGLFDDVGTGIVTADGSTVKTIEGGIRNSSWHMFTPPPPESVDGELNDKNEDKDCDPCSQKNSPNHTPGPSDQEVPMWEDPFKDSDTTKRRRALRGSNNSAGAATSNRSFLDSIRRNPVTEPVAIDQPPIPAPTSSPLAGATPARSQNAGSTGSFGWGAGGRLMMGSQGSFGPYGSWDYSAKPTYPSGFNVTPAPEPVVDASTDPVLETSIALHSGAVHKSHTLVAYQSLGKWRGLELHYDSERADARPIINSTINGVPAGAGNTLVTKLEITRGNMRMTVPGYRGSAVGLTGGEHFFPLGSIAGSAQASLQADMRNLPSGTYTYESSSRIGRGSAFAGRSTTSSDTFVHVNSRESEFGSGWGLSGLTELVENPDGSVLLIDGNGGELQFEAPLNLGDAYVSPGDDFTTLVKLADGRFERTDTDQTVETYSTGGQLVSIVDRNGNGTQFNYDGEGRLISIVDPVGLTTTFRYVDGLISEIEDPAGRITRMTHVDGNLVSIEDPDASVKTFAYDSAGRLTGETDKRGETESLNLDFAGRIDSIVRKDGTTIDYQPVQTANLVRPEISSNPNSVVTAARASDTIAQQVDANGNVTEVTLDKAGQRLGASDGQGNLPDIGRNENNLIQRVVDGRGHVTLMEYDDRGNVIKIVDEIARQSREEIVLAGGAESVATLDADGDGNVDFVVAQPDQDTLSLSLGNGDGTFAEPIEILAVPAVSSVAAMDLDGDGSDDLVVISPVFGEVTVLFNDGVGDFSSSATVAVQEPTDLSFADLDGDNVQDILVGSRRRFHALRNNGDGTFSVTTTSTDLSTGRNRITAGDFDGDGSVDVAIAAPNFTLFRNQIELFSGNGDGTFNTGDVLSIQGGSDDNVEWFVTDVMSVDLDGDGALDLIASTPFTNDAITNNVGIAYGLGDGTFEQALGLASSITPQSLEVGDFNADGQLDLVTANRDAGVVAIAFGSGLRRYDDAFEYNAAAGTNDVAVGDFNNDGFADVVAANELASSATVHFPLANGKRFEYESQFNQLTRTIDEEGRVVLYEIDPTNGNTLSVTEVIGVEGGGDDIVTRYTYTAAGLIETVTDPLGRVVRNDYNAQGLRTRVTYAVGTADEAFVQFEYDAVGNPTAVIDELGHRTEFTYDAMNRVLQTIEADPDGAGPLTSPITTNEYDIQGNLIRTTDAEGKVTQFVYDQQHRLVETIDADGRSIFHEYDNAGNLTANIDRLGRRTEYRYDERNRLAETINAEGGRREYLYDADNNKVAEIDENGVRTDYIYDARNRLISSINALGGVVTYEYDLVDNLIAQTDEIGRRTEMVYDELNRVVEIREADPDGEGPAAVPVSFNRYDRASNLVEIIDALGNVTSMTYDARDRMIQTIESDPDGAGPLASPITTHAYDDANRLVRVIDPLGRESRVVYDDLNRVIEEVLPDPDGAGPDATPITRYSYDAVGNRISRTDALGNVTTMTYDDLHRLVTVVGHDPDGAGPLQSPTTMSIYDVEGQIVAQVDPLGRTTQHEYDLLGRVMKTTLPDADGAGPLIAPVMTYQYDAVGNEISMVDALGNQTITVYDDLHRVIETIGADPDGELGPAERPETRFQYDAAHQLVAITDAIGRTTRYVYDGLGRLVEEHLPDPDGAGPDISPVMRSTFDAMSNRLSTTDALGNTTEYEYDQLYRLVKVTEADPDGEGPEIRPVTTRTYDIASQLIATSDPLGRTTTFAYDDLGRLVQQTRPDPDGAGPGQSPAMTFVYDLIGNQLSMTDALGNTTDYVYDNLYRQTQVVEADPDGAGPDSRPTTTYQFDIASQMVSMTDALGRVTTMEYDDLGRQIKITRPDPDGAGSSAAPETIYAYDNMNNRLSETDALGNTTMFKYDNLYRLVEVVQPDPDDAGPQGEPTTQYEFDLVGQMLAMVDPLNRRTEYDYDGLGRVVRQVSPDPDGAGPLVSPEMTFTFDVMGNQTSMTDAVGNVTDYEYDHLYRRVRIVEADPDSAGPLVRPVSVMAYDVADQLLSAADELGRTTTYEYDDLGRMTRMVQPDPDGAGPLTSPEFEYAYDAMDNLVSEIDPLGFEKTIEYDNLYRVVREFGEDLDGAGPLSQPSTEYTYDLEDNLLSLTDTSGNRTDYAYDDLDRMFEETIELGAGNTVTRQYEFDLEDNLVRSTDRNGRVTEFERDRLYRTVAERWLDGVGGILNTIEFELDEAGQLLRAEDMAAGSRYDFEYDDLGRAISTVSNQGGPAVTHTQVFDAQDRLVAHEATVDGQADFVNAYQYDAIDRLVTMEQSGLVGGNAVAEKQFDFAYNAADQLAEVTRYRQVNASAGDLVLRSVYGYDGNTRLTQLEHFNGSSSLSRYGFEYDTASRLTEIDHSVDGVSQFGYDNDNQLTSATHASQTDENYAFDEDGNRTGGGYATGSYHRLSSDGVYSYEYDAEGNRTKRTENATGEVTEYEWDHRNRLVSVVTRSSEGAAASQRVEHRYDAFNQWISKSVDLDGDGAAAAELTRYEYANGQMVLALDGNGNVAHRYVWGPMTDMLLADEQVGGQVYWTASDHLGSVRDVVDSTGAVVNHVVYDSFGNVASESNSSVDVLFGFTGKAYESTTGLQNNLNRWYDSVVGRWISEDPIQFAAGDSNLYRYVGNGPVDRLDPDGLMEEGVLIKAAKRIFGKSRNTSKTALIREGNYATWRSKQGQQIANDLDHPNYIGDQLRIASASLAGGIEHLIGRKEAAHERLNYARELKQKSIVHNQSVDIEKFASRYGLESLRTKLELALEYGTLAADVYKPDIGKRVKGTDYKSLKKLVNTDSGFYAAVYQNLNTCKYVVVFRGTDNLIDWAENLTQGVGGKSTQYELAIHTAKAAVEALGEENVVFAGHSLGGGLASAAAIVTGRPAVTFDPAGLHPFTVWRHGKTMDRQYELIQSFSLWGEFLTTSENALPFIPDSRGNLLTLPTDKQYRAIPNNENERGVFDTFVKNHGSNRFVETTKKLLNVVNQRIANEN